MRFNIRRSNYSRAGKAAADEVVNIYAAARRNSPDYGKMVQQAADIRSAVKRAGVSAAADVSVAGINAAAKVEKDKIVGKAKRGLKKEQRKAGALGVAGKLFNDAGTLMGEKRDRREVGGEDEYFEAELKRINDQNEGILAKLEQSQSGTADNSTDSAGVDDSSDTVSPNISAQPAAYEGKLSKTQIQELAVNQGFSPEQAKVVVGIAGGESGYDPTNSTKRSGLFAKTGEDSVGLMQINWGYHKDRGWLQDLGITSREQLFDPATNMKAAKYLYDGRGNFGDWTVYNKGIYQDYL